MIIEKKHPLDNCQLFVQLRKCLLDHCGNSKKLQGMMYWSGNEDDINKVCILVNNLLKEHELVLQESHAKNPDELVTRPNGSAAMNHLRGLLVYIILNSATEQSSNWSSQVIHLCRQLPTFPQFLTLAIALNCGLQQPLEEFLAYGPRWLTYQYFETFNDAISHIRQDRFDALPMVFGVLKAASRSIYRHNLPEKNKQLLRVMASMLQRHFLDTNERLSEALPRGAKRRRYVAVVMQQMLAVLLETLADPKESEKPECFTIYSQMSMDISSSYSNDHTDLRLFAMLLLDAAERIMQLITVDMFMYWLEIPSEVLLYSYQELICCQASELLKLVEHDEELKQHAVCKQLKSFAEAAKSYKERLAELTIGDLLHFLDNDRGEATDEQLVAGLDNLFDRSIAFGNDECVETIATHLRLLTKDHALKILTHLGQVVESKMVTEDEGISVTEIKQEIDEDKDMEETMSVSGDEDEYKSLLNSVLRPVFKNLSSLDKIQVLQTRDMLHVTENFNFENADHQERRIRFFNRLDPNKEFPLVEFLELCYENAKQTWMDFARLAVTTYRFMLFFWRLAVHCCPKHAVFHISDCANEFLQDEELLLKPNAMRFLLTLYGHRQILNGLYMASRKLCVRLGDGFCPYEKEQLKQAQDKFLMACAAGLAKFSEPLNYTSLQLILLLLMKISVAEEKLIFYGLKELLKLKKVYTQNEGKDSTIIKEAKDYIDMHACLPEWRQENWPLISQLMVTIDALRWDLTNYEKVRVDTLGLALRYWGKGISHMKILSVEFRQKIINLASNLRHKDFWVVNLEETGSTYNRRFISLITQASGLEATRIFAKVLLSRTDCSLMGELSDAVVEANCQSALQAFKYLFRKYLIAYRHHVRVFKPNKRLLHWEHLMAVVAKAPISIREYIKDEAHRAFATRLRITAVKNKPETMNRESKETKNIV
ncbi:uncharacterized protein LOC108110410 [Drosophila eugracilis]|uniref:uncharacterized protein LOC108110410 n=1 Tax=Drosophila eugracilis TaxID=29029 RepID=UPI0007E83828|nr:uncharacterized protein LOC108110410 [Drosophila eugracilis]